MAAARFLFVSLLSGRRLRVVVFRRLCRASSLTPHVSPCSTCTRFQVHGPDDGDPGHKVTAVNDWDNAQGTLRNVESADFEIVHAPFAQLKFKKCVTPPGQPATCRPAASNPESVSLVVVS